jgi:hypothetical protein
LYWQLGQEGKYWKQPTLFLMSSYLPSPIPPPVSVGREIRKTKKEGRMVQFWLRRGEKLEPNKTTSMEKGLFVYFPDYLERVRKGGFTSNPQLCVSQVQMHVWCPWIGWRLDQ